jgi:hypothetical protein
VTEINQPTKKLQRNRNAQPSEMPKLRLCAVTFWRLQSAYSSASLRACISISSDKRKFVARIFSKYGFIEGGL